MNKIIFTLCFFSLLFFNFEIKGDLIVNNYVSQHGVIFSNKSFDREMPFDLYSITGKTSHNHGEIIKISNEDFIIYDILAVKSVPNWLRMDIESINYSIVAESLENSYIGTNFYPPGNPNTPANPPVGPPQAPPFVPPPWKDPDFIIPLPSSLVLFVGGLILIMRRKGV